jgi:ABC-2 type transport system ATP-binding protein
MAVLYTTHYMEEAERLCDRIGIIDSGRSGRGHPRRADPTHRRVDTIRLRGSGDLTRRRRTALRDPARVEQVDADRQTRCMLTVRDAPALVADMVGCAAEPG